MQEGVMRFDPGPGGAADPDGMSTITGLPGSADRAGEFTLNVPEVPDLPGGVRLGRYEVFDEAARGGMGVVYRAADTLFGRYVAVKVLRAGLAGDRHAVRRLADEARITAQLQHPGIPPVYDLGTLPDGRPFLVTELIRGSNLDELLRDGVAVPPRDELVGVFERVCEAVAYAHRERVVHRDLKPHNVMIGAFGEVKVLDWGLAKVLTAGRAGVRLPTADGSGATAPGAVLGTPNYMPPEQAAGEVELTDERADVFGLGAILCFVLTGQPPFMADTAGEARLAALRGAVGEAFARLSRCGADPELVALCKRCLAPDPAGRPRDAGEVVTAVRAYRAAAEHLGRAEDLIQASIDGERRVTGLLAAEARRRRWVEAALAVAVALLVAVAGWVVLHGR
jgi:serine/threonine-protein kinase